MAGHVCRQLIARGDRVRILDLPSAAGLPALPKEAEFVAGDLRDIRSLEKFFRVPEGTETVILHIASVVSLDLEYNQKLMDINVKGTENILKMCLSHKECRKLVYCGSTGAIPERPLGQKIREVDHFDPELVKGCYSKSKAMAAQAVMDAVHNSGLPACLVHPTGIMGPEDYGMGGATDRVVRIVNGEMPVGIDGTFNLADARDLADGIIRAADYGVSGKNYILGNEMVSFRDFVRILSDVSGCRPISHFLSVEEAYKMAEAMEKEAKAQGKRPLMTSFAVWNLARNNDFDSSLAKKELGYHTRSYEETLSDEVEWLIKEGKIRNIRRVTPSGNIPQKNMSQKKRAVQL